MYHRDEYIQKNIIIFKIRFFFEFSLFLFDFEHYEFRISCLKFENFKKYRE